MKLLTTTLLLFCLAAAAYARTIEVRTSGAYTNLQAAAAVAQPGDTILFRAGTYQGGQSVANLQGRAGAWITIMAQPDEEVILQGGTNAWQLSDPAYVRIEGFILQGQTGNGLNIDDGGSMDTPARRVSIRRCEWRGIDATGNNDLLKLSGLDSFEVRECIFRNGAAGGSMIDMVGCHSGIFANNRFENGGSNCIQAKGGTRYILIERNVFLNGGSRALNIGGSTGLEFFRPIDADYEASYIAVYSNMFVGADAPIAYVGAVNCVVANNTIYLPKRWAVRILQESTQSRFLQCGDNAFLNNIVVVGAAAANPTFNVGPNTRPTTFLFQNNLWYNAEAPNWPGPNLPAPETDGMIGTNPQLAAPPGDLALRPGSPAIGRGRSLPEPEFDFFGRRFEPNRSIGAVEGATQIGSAPRIPELAGATVTVLRSAGLLRVSAPCADVQEVMLFDMRGERVLSARTADGHVTAAGLSAGTYLCVVSCGERVLGVQTIFWR